MSHFLLTVEVTSLVQPLTTHIRMRSSFVGGALSECDCNPEAAAGSPSHRAPPLPSLPPLSRSFLLVLAPRSMNLKQECQISISEKLIKA